MTDPVNPYFVVVTASGLMLPGGSYSVYSSVPREIVSQSVAGLAYAFSFTAATYVIIRRAVGQKTGFRQGTAFALRKMARVWVAMLGNLGFLVLGFVALLAITLCIGLFGGVFGAVVPVVWYMFAALAGGMIAPDQPLCRHLRCGAYGVGPGWC